MIVYNATYFWCKVIEMHISQKINIDYTTKSKGLCISISNVKTKTKFMLQHDVVISQYSKFTSAPQRVNEIWNRDVFIIYLNQIWFYCYFLQSRFLKFIPTIWIKINSGLFTNNPCYMMRSFCNNFFHASTKWNEAELWWNRDTSLFWKDSRIEGFLFW